MKTTKVVLGVAAASLLAWSGCTIHHSKVVVSRGDEGAPADDAVFVTEDDSGLALLGLFVLTEPDHYAILVERARKRYKCTSLSHIQLDFYTDFWLFAGFPIARITAICERGETRSKSRHHGGHGHHKQHERYKRELHEKVKPTPPAPPTPPTPPPPPEPAPAPADPKTKTPG